MAAVTLTLEVPDVVTLGTTNTAQEYTVPAEAQYLRLYFRGNAGRFAVSGTDGAAMGSDYETYPGDQVHVRPVPRPAAVVQGGGTVFIAGSADAVVVEVTALRREPS